MAVCAAATALAWTTAAGTAQAQEVSAHGDGVLPVAVQPVELAFAPETLGDTLDDAPGAPAHLGAPGAPALPASPEVPAAPEAGDSESSDCGPRSCPKRSKWRQEARRGRCGSRSWRWGYRHRHADRFAVGISKGHFESEGREVRERSVVARLRLTRRLTAEVEAGKSRPRDRDGAPGELRDKRVGGGLLLHPIPWARLSPYLSAAGGVVRTDVSGRADADGVHIDQRYREVGVGLSIRLGKRLRIEGDFRTGERELREGAKSAAAAIGGMDDEQRYRRARITALLYF